MKKKQGAVLTISVFVFLFSVLFSPYSKAAYHPVNELKKKDPLIGWTKVKSFFDPSKFHQALFQVTVEDGGTLCVAEVQIIDNSNNRLLELTISWDATKGDENSILCENGDVYDNDPNFKNRHLSKYPINILLFKGGIFRKKNETIIIGR